MAEDTEGVSNAERLNQVLARVFSSPETAVDNALITRMVEGLEPITDEQVTVEMVGAEDFAASFQGISGLHEAWADWLEAFAEVRFRVEDMKAVGENVVTFGTQIGTTRHGGVEIEQPSAAVWKFHDGRIQRVEFHLDRETALRSAQSTQE